LIGQKLKCSKKTLVGNFHQTICGHTKSNKISTKLKLRVTPNQNRIEEQTSTIKLTQEQTYKSEIKGINFKGDIERNMK
jgi:hypothetical protein